MAADYLTVEKEGELVTPEVLLAKVFSSPGVLPVSILDSGEREARVLNFEAAEYPIPGLFCDSIKSPWN